MGERSKYLTIIVREPTQDEASALIGHAKMSAASWSHAIEDRDAKDAEIAELREKYEAVVGKYDAAVEKSIAMMQERDEACQERENLSHRLGQCVLQRDEARECVKRLYPLAGGLLTVWEGYHFAAHSPKSRRALEPRIAEIKDALAATPEHLR